MSEAPMPSRLQGQVVAFRADASLEIGSGHVMRCLTLADVLQAQGAQCHFLCREHPGHLCELIEARGYPAHRLPQEERDTGTAGTPGTELEPAHANWLGASWAQDAAACQPILAELAPAWLVVDHYALDHRWERAVLDGLPGSRPRLLVIDDLADRRHVADLLLDQNLGRQAEDYSGLVPKGCQVLAGPRYALLRPEFREWREASLSRRAREPGLQRLLINLGGVDKDNVTGQVLDALTICDLPADLQISVVMGASAPWRESVTAQARAMPWPTEVVVNISDMARRMAEADLAIGAAGSTSWERCCLGLPSIIVEIADNQAGIVAAVVRAGAGIAPSGLHTSCFVHSFGNVVTKAIELSRLKVMSNAASEICDGDGASRVVQALISKGITVRPALSDDAENVWRWRNDGVSTEFYLSQKKTEFNDHLVWFESALASPERDLLIVEIGRESAAHVRFDRCLENKGAAEVSIYLNPSFRGRGLGAPILIAACNFVFAKGLSLILAQVHVENTASLKIFTRAGFKQLSINGSFKALGMARPTFPRVDVNVPKGAT